MIIFYLKEAFSGIFKKRLYSFVTIVTTVVAVLLCTASIFITLASGKIEQKLSDKIKLNIFLEDGISSELRNELESKLKNDNSIESYKFIDKETAKKDFIRRTGRDFSGLLEINPLPSSYVVKPAGKGLKGKTVEQISSVYGQMEGVEEVSYDYAFNMDLLSYMSVMKNVVYAVAGFLVILSVYMIYSVNILIIESRKELFRNMRFMGAPLSSIKMPVYLQGVIIGVISSVIACAIIFGVNFLLRASFISINFVTFTNYIFILYSSVILLGFSMGIAGSIISSSKISKFVKDI